MFTNKIVSVSWRFFFFGFAIWMVAFYFLFSTSTTAVTPQDLPPLKNYPLPETLTQWQDPNNSGDYFDQIEVKDVGYLIWSHFPIKVYIESDDNNESKSREWVKTVIDAIWEWNVYLPLEVVNNPEVADINFFNKRPPLRLENLRARSAETRYQLYQDENGVLFHKFVIWLSPMQVGKYLPAAARHEFGHALGIWGHSPEKTDVMYYSQVAAPPPISSRDVNTLKKVYLQSTRLGTGLISNPVGVWSPNPRGRNLARPLRLLPIVAITTNRILYDKLRFLYHSEVNNK
ncbi:peptidase [Okeania sp.]|uniref:peptidase n=1 Tax=Okeania sp. TaxID=3100323 RepID=UPI002B4AD019|nr:peptidase [Okeania sp.]MEB3342966.1 peptidase [Okeania sp.]